MVGIGKDVTEHHYAVIAIMAVCRVGAGSCSLVVQAYVDLDVHVFH